MKKTSPILKGLHGDSTNVQQTTNGPNVPIAHNHPVSKKRVKCLGQDCNLFRRSGYSFCFSCMGQLPSYVINLLYSEEIGRRRMGIRIALEYFKENLTVSETLNDLGAIQESLLAFLENRKTPQAKRMAQGSIKIISKELEKISLKEITLQ